MNGAITDPCANSKKAPKISIIRIIGPSQSFFLAFKNENISRIRPSFIIKIDP
tara:strand:- start:1427 stop:1585 length:159 start_codon:yes stop_codon:yes gene_type:complete